MITPTIPPEPTGTNWQEWDIYLRAVHIANEVEASAIRAQQAKAQADTAAAMDRAAKAQEDVVSEMSAPYKPTRAELAMKWFENEPVTLDDTVSSIMARIAKQVDAFAKANPSALRD